MDLDNAERAELHEELACLARLFKEDGEGFLAYEHCARSDTERGCVNHAHVHCLPVSLRDEANLVHVLESLEDAEPSDNIHLRIWRPNGHWNVSGQSKAENARSALEEAVAGDSRAWRERLEQDLDELPSLLRGSVEKMKRLKHAVAA